MTPINRPLSRQTQAARFSNGKQRPIILELSPPGDKIGFRLKGTRTTYYLAISTAFGLAAQAWVNARKAARAEAKKKAKHK